MKGKVPKLGLYTGILAVSLLTVCPLRAQVVDATLSGTVTDASGAAVPGAKISVKNLDGSIVTETQADSAGRFKLIRLTPGDYEVTATADGFSAVRAQVALNAGAAQTLNLAMASRPAQPQTPGANLPNAPSSSKTEPSLSDLGFSQEQLQSNAKEQALLDRRTRLLKIHQKLGLITTAPLIATVITSIGAGGKSESTGDRTAHMVLGAVSSDLYFMTAYFAIRAPRVPGTTTRGPIKFHKAMAWIHGPGMILTPILGALAYSQKSNGEHVHGIAAAHGPVAIVTAGAFGAALLSVSVKF